MELLTAQSLNMDNKNLAVQTKLLKESNEFSGELAKELLDSLPSSGKVNHTAAPGQQVRILAR